MEDRINTALRLASAARAAHKGESFLFAPADYVDKVEFRFMPRGKSVFGGFKASCAEQWYDHLEALGLSNVYAYFDYSYENVPAVYCEFEDGTVTKFSVQTDVRKNRKLYIGSPNIAGVSVSYDSWYRIRVALTESSAQPIDTRYTDNSSSLRSILQRAEDFSMRLKYDDVDCRQYARSFSEAVQLLDGKQVNRTGMFVPLPALSERNLRIYRACETADIYDRSSGWSGIPAALAQKLGCIDWYKDITYELLKHTQLALLYAINED